MYPFNWREKGTSKKTRDILIIAVAVLLILNVAQFILYRSTATRDSILRDAIVSQAGSDINSAVSAASNVARTGGSNTQRLLSEIRQYLYSVTRLNQMTEMLFGGGQMVVPQDTVDAAVAALDACEAKQQAAAALDVPLSELWQTLGELRQAVDAL